MAPVSTAKSAAASDMEVLEAPPCSFKLPLKDLCNGINFGSFESDGVSTTGVSTTDSARTASEAETPKLPIVARKGKQSRQHQTASAPLPGHLQDQGFQPVIDLGVDEVTQMASEEVARFSDRLKNMSAEILHCDSSYERNRCIKRAMADYETAMKWVQMIEPPAEEAARNSGAECDTSNASMASAAPLNCQPPVAGGEALGASILAMVQQAPMMLSTQPVPLQLPPTGGQEMPPPPSSPPRFLPEASVDGSPFPQVQHAGYTALSVACSPSRSVPGNCRASELMPGAQSPSMQNGQLLPYQFAPVPEWPKSSPSQGQGGFGMQDGNTMQGMQQQLLQTSPQRSQQHNNNNNNAQQHMPYGGRSPQGMHQQQPYGGMPLMQQQGGQQAAFMQQGMQHMQDPSQCLLATPGSQSPLGLQNLSRNSGPGMQSPFGEAGMPVPPCGFQLLALPAGVAPPEGAIPAPAALQPQASMQFNSQWDAAHQNNNSCFPIFDTHSGQALQHDCSRDARRFRIVNPETGKEVLPGCESQDNSSRYMNNDQPRQWDATHER